MNTTATIKTGKMTVDADHVVEYIQRTGVSRITQTTITCTCGHTQIIRGRLYKWQAANHTTANPLTLG